MEIVESTKASVIIPKLDRIFSVHGIPEIIKSDNRPPFQGEEFCKYCNALGIKHERITPRWPQANGEVERFNQPLAKTIQAAIVAGKPCRQELHRFLLQLRKYHPVNCYLIEQCEERCQFSKERTSLTNINQQSKTNLNIKNITNLMLIPEGMLSTVNSQLEIQFL